MHIKQIYLHASKILQRGGIGVLPTDTIYGVVASACDPSAVERVYRVRGRDRRKPCIVLIASVIDIARFGISVDAPTKRVLKMLWSPQGRRMQPTSVILPCPGKQWAYLHRGTQSLAFRLPVGQSRRVQLLRKLLAKTGPLIAPSANLQGQSPAQTMQEAKASFGDAMDFYVSAGRRLAGASSRVVRVVDGVVEVVRR